MIAWKGPLPIYNLLGSSLPRCIPSPTLNLILKEVVSAVTTTGFANFTRPSSLSTSPEDVAWCPLVSTKYPLIDAVVLLISGTSAFVLRGSPAPAKCSKVSTNFPGVIALEPQTELLVWPLACEAVPEPATVPQKLLYHQSFQSLMH